MGWGSSPYIIWAEDDVEKSPENFITTSSLPWTKATRALGALRLLGPGEITMSQMWITRTAKFNVGLGGLQASGWRLPASPREPITH